MRTVDTRERAVDVNEAATILGSKPATMYSKPWRDRVGLKAIRIGRALRFRESDLYRLIDKGTERLPEAHVGRR